MERWVQILQTLSWQPKKLFRITRELLGCCCNLFVAETADIVIIVISKVLDNQWSQKAPYKVTSVKILRLSTPISPTSWVFSYLTKIWCSDFDIFTYLYFYWDSSCSKSVTPSLILPYHTRWHLILISPDSRLARPENLAHSLRRSWESIHTSIIPKYWIKFGAWNKDLKCVKNLYYTDSQENSMLLLICTLKTMILVRYLKISCVQ